MPDARALSGEITYRDEPEWRPLVDLIGLDLAPWFMWMYAVSLEDGTTVHAYKHVATRRYLHLSEDRRLFVYCSPSRYVAVLPRIAIDEAFDGWEDLALAPGDAERAALERLRAAPMS